MASKTVRDEFAAYITANWTATPVQYASIDLAKLKPTPPNNTLNFLVIEYPPSNERRASIGDTQNFRERGVIRTYVCGPSAQDNNALLTLVEDYRNLIRGKAIGGVLFITSADPGEDQGRILEGNTHVFIVEAIYYRDYNY